MEPGTEYFARCPYHGLHGQRERCYECGTEAEQVPFVRATPACVQLVSRLLLVIFGIGAGMGLARSTWWADVAMGMAVLAIVGFMLIDMRPGPNDPVKS